MIKHLLAPLLCSLLALACQPQDDVQARVGELTDQPGLRVRIVGSDLAPGQVHAIAKHLEGQAQDTGAAMVKMRKEDGQAPTLDIELWGGTLPAGGDLPADLKAAFPALAGATITTEALAPGQGPSMPVIPVDPDLSPAEAEQHIRDGLAAEGVDGQVNVKVVDGPDGRRIEVGVEKHEIH